MTLTKYQLYLISAKKVSITKNFTLFDICNSETALAKNIDNRPTQDLIKNATNLIKNVLQPIRDHFALPLDVHCIFRCYELNKLLGGSQNSQHLKAQACDFTVKGKINDEIFNWVKNNLIYDQLIHEGSWIHVSLVAGKNRKQSLKLLNGKYIPA